MVPDRSTCAIRMLIAEDPSASATAMAASTISPRDSDGVRCWRCDMRARPPGRPRLNGGQRSSGLPIAASAISAALDESLTGQANLVMTGQLSRLTGRQAKERATEMLARFGLSDAAGRGVKTYSGGMRRRLDLAASLVGRPRILFLDEPTTGLDARSRMVTWDAVRELAAAGPPCC
jgi:ABC-type dipeptide/oligopeptide/nickel transport system ATPase component